MILLATLGPAIREIRLNRPARANALNRVLVEKLLEEVTTAYSDGTRLLILRGTGKNFCSGFDQSSEDPPSIADISSRTMQIEALLQLLWHAPFVTLARVHGAAVGAGADLVAICDYRLGSADVRMAFPGFRKFGVTLGTRRLASLIGSHRAFDLVLRSRTVQADEAHSLGLLTHLFDEGSATAFVSKLRADLEEVRPRSLEILREATRGEAAAAGDLSRVARSLAFSRRE